MNPLLKNIIAVIVGIIVGSIVNMGLIMISGSIIPPPPGVDLSDMESLKAGMHLFQTKHFIFPFLAHSLGTLVGAFFTALIASNRKLLFAFIIGIFFLAGGIMNLFMLPSPVWFAIVDIILAYIPFAWFAWKIASIIIKKN